MVEKMINLGRKYTRIQQQYKFLQESKKQGTIPDGIYSQCRFKCSVQDATLQRRCEELMHNTASRILDTFLIYYRTWAEKST